MIRRISCFLCLWATMALACSAEKPSDDRLSEEELQELARGACEKQDECAMVFDEQEVTVDECIDSRQEMYHYSDRCYTLHTDIDLCLVEIESCLSYRDNVKWYAPPCGDLLRNASGVRCDSWGAPID